MTQSPASVRCTKGAVPNLAIGSQLRGNLLPNLLRCAIVVSRIAAINLNCLSFSVALRVPLSLSRLHLYDLLLWEHQLNLIWQAFYGLCKGHGYFRVMI